VAAELLCIALVSRCQSVNHTCPDGGRRVARSGPEHTLRITSSSFLRNFCSYEYAIARIWLSFLVLRMLQTSISSVPTLPSVAL
jgi:hypothetical protein